MMAESCQLTIPKCQVDVKAIVAVELWRIVEDKAKDASRQVLQESSTLHFAVSGDVLLRCSRTINSTAAATHT